MKLSTPNLVRFLILLGVTLAAFEVQAHPPVQHSTQGMIQSIDLTNHSLALVERKATNSRIFIWKDSTRFREGGQKASSDSLHAGQSIKVYYRRESGRLTLREVRWNKANSSELQGQTRTGARP